MTVIWAARHAPAMVHGVCYGRTQVPVDRPAAGAAEQLAAQLVGHLRGITPTCVWSSASDRCAEPAACLAQALQVPHVIDDRLAELHFGAWEGQRWDDLDQRDGLRLAAWMADWQHLAPPGGEALADLVARVGAWWAALPPNHTGVLVGHAGVLRCLSVLHCGFTWPQALATPVQHLHMQRFSSQATTNARSPAR